MSTTPGKPRQSGIPTPGRPSGIPTPGRSRASSSANSYPPVSSDVEYMSRAFADAIKANDPAQHRSSRASDASTVQISPPSSSLSGRRSVTGRPSSVASSTAGTTPYRGHVERSKTPTAVRSASRQSDVFRISSRAGRVFDVGDNVRIESLGFEGILRYLGAIEGKIGLWAGVELSGGFAGMGKNDGVVSGKQYFNCPPKCGVFVATTKLSAPTIGNPNRPSSVASSRGGRVTPSTPAFFQNGRVTPSASNGRITPSFLGRITPSTTPARPQLRALSKSTAKTPTIASQGKIHRVENKITNGSRASVYLNMTAKQLNTRNSVTSPATQRTGSPSRSIPSPTRSSLNFGSPTRSSSSPFTTPKPGGRVSNIGVGQPSSSPARNRPSLTTPRARLPSAVAMPPPASPKGSSRSVSLNDGPFGSTNGTPQNDGDHTLMDLEVNGKTLQDNISALISGKTTPSTSKVSSRPSSVASVRSSSSYAAEYQAQLDRLQSRVDSLEYENHRLRDSAKFADTNKLQAANTRIETLDAQRKEAINRVSEADQALKTAERSLHERQSKLETLERSALQASAEAERAKIESESRFKDIQAKLEDRDVMVKSLKEAIEAKEGVENQNDAVLKAKNSEIALLESRLQKVSVEWEQDRRDLSAQIDELRQAGQETIALYEERLSAADTGRYELEDRIAFLEDQMRKGRDTAIIMGNSRHESSAAEIDNETLREQVLHLQNKIQSLEDMLEDAQIAAEKEETINRERIRRLKEKEDTMKKELGEGRKEVEQVLKSEANHRDRVEENEEALRESTMALENARAEIEVLRAEIANLDSLAAASAPIEASQKLAESTSRTASERTRFNQEIKELKYSLEESRSAHREISDDLQAYRQKLEERSAELELLKKKLNRESSMNAGLQEPHRNSRSGSPQSPSSSKSGGLSAAREEITGLKHIVQELQQEAQVAASRNRLLESENRLLISETDQLRQELKVLEENVEQSIMREEEALDNKSFSPTSADAASLQKALREQKAKFEVELELLRKRSTEADMKIARVKHDANKEISELEALVESKIYREDELEQEVERLKARDRRKSGKLSMDPNHARARISPATSDRTSLLSTSDSDHEVCEICDRPGHDTFNCDRLNGPATLFKANPAAANPLDVRCEDCDAHGHLAADCPHAMDVF